MNPKNANYLKKLASIYMTTGQFANAKEIYERIIKQGSVNPQTYYELSILCVKTNDLDRAEQILKKVCGLNPDFAPAHKDLGVIYLNKRLFDYAKDEFEKHTQLIRIIIQLLLSMQIIFIQHLISKRQINFIKSD